MKSGKWAPPASQQAVIFMLHILAYIWKWCSSSYFCDYHSQRRDELESSALRLQLQGHRSNLSGSPKGEEGRAQSEFYTRVEKSFYTQITKQHHYSLYLSYVEEQVLIKKLEWYYYHDSLPLAGKKKAIKKVCCSIPRKDYYY